MQVKPSLKEGQRVQYTEDGILSITYGVVVSYHFNESSDQIEYRVKWDHGIDDSLYPRSRLNPV